MQLVIDVETRSVCDLAKVGPWRYAADPTTSLLCAAWKVDDEPTRLWLRGKYPPLIPWQQADRIIAHNLEFERAILLLQLGIDLPLDRCDCTAARAAAMALPRKLEEVARVLRVSAQKDLEGHKLMLKMSKPRKPRKGEAPGLYWHEKPEDLERLGRYCMQDVEAEYQVSRVLFDLFPNERRVWVLDQTINQRGVQVDVPAVGAIVATLDRHEEDLLTEYRALTGLSSPRQRDATKAWLEAGLGVGLDDIRKDTVAAIETEDPTIRRVVEIRQSLSKSSTAKLATMLACAGDDHRARGLHVYCGAGTGRWSGKLIQTQNLPRDSYEDEEMESARAVFATRDPGLVSLLLGDPFHAASRCIRGLLKAAPGKVLIGADFSSIEARAIAHLAGEKKVLEAFRSGLDLYKVAACDVYGVKYDEVSKEQRQVGKVVILACGYQGGVGAFQSMAKIYGVKVPDEEAKAIVDRWRAGNPAIVSLWRGLEQAAKTAIREEGQSAEWRGIPYRVIKDVMGNKYLICKLPSGRLLFYFDPRLEMKPTAWGERESITYMGVDPTTKRWVRQQAYGGLLTENIVQAFCRDLMASAMLRLEAAEYPVVLHIHDEVVAEVPAGTADLGRFERIMSEVPRWAAGMPIAAKGWVGERFRK